MSLVNIANITEKVSYWSLYVIFLSLLLGITKTNNVGLDNTFTSVLFIITLINIISLIIILNNKIKEFVGNDIRDQQLKIAIYVTTAFIVSLSMYNMYNTKQRDINLYGVWIILIATANHSVKPF
jgi:hypothetical protein